MISTLPFFILGNPRSGTSLLRIILNAHPNIVVPPESGFLQWWKSKYKNWERRDNYSDRLDQFITDLLSSKKIEAFGLERIGISDYIRECSPTSYSELVATIYRYYGRDKDIHVWGDKNNYYIHHIPELLELYPEARFVHLVRDGRDVACSYLELNQIIESEAKYRPKLVNTIPGIAEEWVDNNQKIERELRECPLIFVRFEDLVTNFQSEITKIFDFLGLSWSDDVERYYLHNDEPESTLKWKQKTKMEPQKGTVGRFLHELDSSQIATFEKIAGQLLTKYQYKLLN